MGKKYQFKDHTEVKAEDVEHIVELVFGGFSFEAQAAFQGLCKEIEDLKDFEAYHLAMKIRENAQQRLNRLHGKKP